MYLNLSSKHLIFLYLILNIAESFAQNSCKTPSGKDGTCIQINRCHDLYKLFRSNTTTEQENTMLRQSECEMRSLQYKVCCETPSVLFDCTTPDNTQGKCTHIYKCPNVRNLLSISEPLPPNIVTYLDKSQEGCEHINPDTLCCDENTPSVTPNIPATLLLPEDCGRNPKKDRIVGGAETGIGDYPWLALIEYKNGIDSKAPVSTQCGGSLINEKYVLTAAHCVVLTSENKFTKIHVKPVSVRLGEFDTSTDLDCAMDDPTFCNEPHESIAIEKIIPHPDYDLDHPYFYNDIALIRLERPVKITGFYITPVCLPKYDTTIGLANQGAKYTVAGWGRWGVTDERKSSNRKMEVDIPYIDHDHCRKYFAERNVSITIWEKQLCAGGLDGKDSCGGDSGGPLVGVVKDDQIYELIGIVSYGSNQCGKANHSAVYTKVFSYLPWIESMIEL